MKIPPDAVIPEEKLTHYLLMRRERNDKSQYLERAGFLPDHPAILESAIRQLTTDAEAVEDGVNEYGVFYRVEGNLVGPDGQLLPVMLIWLQWQVDGRFRFVTLKPRRD